MTPDWMPPLPHHGFLNDEIMVYTRQQIVDYALAAVESYKRSPEARRDRAIAQAVDEVDNTGDYALAVCHEYMRYVMRRADELLKEGK